MGMRPDALASSPPTATLPRHQPPQDRTEMSQNTRDALAEVIHTHRWRPAFDRCACGSPVDTIAHPSHVADALIAAGATIS